MDGMNLAKKLERLIGDRNRAAIAAAVGVTPATIYAYLSGSTPASDIGQRLALELGVDAGWLFNDAQGWPPKRATQMLSDLGLLDEVDGRAREASRRLTALLDRAAALPWQQYADQLQANPGAWAKWDEGGAKPVGALGAAVHVARMLMMVPNTPPGRLIAMAYGREQGKAASLDPRIHTIIDQLTFTKGGKDAMLAATAGFVFFDEDFLAQIEEALDKHDKAVKAQ